MLGIGYTKMYVCICNSVTDRDIAEAVDQGARTLAHLADSLDVGTCCGRCRGKADACLDRCLQRSQPTMTAPPALALIA